jgi:hypothetical protein
MPPCYIQRHAIEIYEEGEVCSKYFNSGIR